MEKITKDEISTGTYVSVKPVSSLEACKTQCENYIDQCFGVEYISKKQKCDIFTEMFSHYSSKKRGGRFCSAYVASTEDDFQMTKLKRKTIKGKSSQEAAGMQPVSAACEMPPCDGSVPSAVSAATETCSQPPCDGTPNNEVDSIEESVMECTSPPCDEAHYQESTTDYSLITGVAGGLLAVGIIAFIVVRRRQGEKASSYNVMFEVDEPAMI